MVNRLNFYALPQPLFRNLGKNFPQLAVAVPAKPYYLVQRLEIGGKKGNVFGPGGIYKKVDHAPHLFLSKYGFLLFYAGQFFCFAGAGQRPPSHLLALLIERQQVPAAPILKAGELLPQQGRKGVPFLPEQRELLRGKAVLAEPGFQGQLFQRFRGLLRKLRAEAAAPPKKILEPGVKGKRGKVAVCLAEQPFPGGEHVPSPQEKQQPAKEKECGGKEGREQRGF